MLLLRKFISHSFIRNYSDCGEGFRNISIKDALNRQKGDKVTIKAWVKSLRKMKDNVFIDVNDGSCSKVLQVLIPTTQKLKMLTTGASVVISGNLNLSPNGQLELNADDMHVPGQCVVSEGYPFAPRKSYTPEYVRQHLHFRSRTNKFASLLRVRHAAMKAIHDHFDSEEYVNIHTPILTSNDCEGAGEVFSIRPENKTLLKNMLKDGLSPDEAYFNSKVFLTVSGQLHLEAMVHGLKKVYSFGPIFRAENSRSRLHLSEFYMIEAETAFIDDLEMVLKTIENLIKSVTKELLDKCSSDIGIVNAGEVRNFNWCDKPFIIMTYDEVLSILDKHKNKLSSDVNRKEGLNKEHELFIVDYNGNIPTFVINWPKDMKPFYMKQCKDDSSKVAALDLLTPYTGEMVGGSLRESDYDTLKRNLPVGKKELDWYLELRKFGNVPTGGFGMGFERYLQLLLAINNIKDTIPFPRWPHNCNL